MKRALTGIKPTGEVHLGNLLGAIQPAIELQARFEAYYFIADYHALTSVEEAGILRQASYETTATWLALGLDPMRSVLFKQSSVPEVAELAWILSCIIPVGMLERGHAVKAARDGGFEANVGTWYYPVLMAADILLYDSVTVPVGRDQKQHVEIARDIAIKFNHRYGEGSLVVPNVSIRDEVAVVPGLDGRKMSKSYGNQIPLWREPKELRKLIMRIVTDSRGVEDVKDPDSCNIFALYKLFASSEQIDSLREQYLKPGLGYGHAKQALFEAIDEKLKEPRDRYQEWMSTPRRLDEVLDFGGERARKAALVTLDRVRSRVGLTKSVHSPNVEPLV